MDYNTQPTHSGANAAANGRSDQGTQVQNSLARTWALRPNNQQRCHHSIRCCSIKSGIAHQ